MTSERYYNYYDGDYAVYRPAYPRRERPVVRRVAAGYGTRRPVSRAEGTYQRSGYRADRRAPGRGTAARQTDAQRRPNPARKPTRSRRRAPGIPAAAKLGAAILLLALLIFGGVKLLGNVRASNTERFAENVYVNGVCLTGYTRDEGFQLMYDKRDQWLNQVHTLTFQDRTWKFSPASVNAKLDLDPDLERAWSLGHMGDRESRRMVTDSLKTTPAEFICEPTYDETALDKFVNDIAEEVYVEPIDAEVTLTARKPEITRASQNGWKLDTDEFKANLIEMIETGSGNTNVPVHEVEPVITSDANEMRMIAKCETDVTFRGYPSRTNVRLALECFNLFTVYPGDTVSFNDVVGPRTEAMGYQEAPEYAGSTKEMGIGGGVCQASTTMYNALIQAGMTIIERHRHTMTVSYVDPSLDAAVNYGKKDLVFRNDTEHAIYIYTNVTKELATVIIYGTRPEYHYVLESKVISKRASENIGYQNDMEGKYVYLIDDPPVLYKKGLGSCESEGWIVSLDWDTGEEVSRVQLSHDTYSGGVSVYWRGVHYPDGTVATDEELAALKT